MKYLKIYWKKALDVEGRCSRRTFWMTALINACIEGICIGGGLLVRLLGAGANNDTVMVAGTVVIFIGIAYSALSAPAGICMAIRRLHDRNIPGILVILIAFPAVQLFVLAMLIAGPKDAGNRWGLQSD